MRSMEIDMIDFIVRIQCVDVNYATHSREDGFVIAFEQLSIY